MARLSASSFVLSVRFSPATAREPLKPYPTGGLGMSDGTGMAHDPHVYVAISPQGDVIIVTARAEMGTGIRTSLPMIIADEMEADWSRVSLVQAPGDEAALRQPGHGRLAQHAALHSADARMRRGHAADARDGSGG